MNLEIFYQVSIIDQATGKKQIIQPRTRSRSFLANFAAVLACQLSQQNFVFHFIDFNGVNRSANVHAQNFLMIGTEASGYWGIQVGTGITPVTQQDYFLANLILHGETSGRLHYNSGSFSNLSGTAAYTKFSTTRTFTNNSGASITVKETGITACIYISSATADYALIVRDLITPVPVLPTKTLEIEYTVQVTL